MNKILGFSLGLLVYFLLMFYVLDLNLTDVISKDNQDAVEIAGRAAISQSINRGVLRVEEEITIDPEVAEAVFLKTYAKNVSYNEPSTIRRINMNQISSQPPMISVEVTTKTNSYTKSYLNQWDSTNEDTKNLTNNREIIIYEAKQETKPPEGGIN